MNEIRSEVKIFIKQIDKHQFTLEIVTLWVLFSLCALVAGGGAGNGGGGGV